MTTFADIQSAAQHLRRGGLVAFPTETVYGLGADALNPAAVAGVFEAKGRPTTNPLIVHVSGPEAAKRLVPSGAWRSEADRLTRAFWPGPLTLVLPRADIIPLVVTGGGPTVAVRCPDHPVALALLFEFGGPLVGPSANRSGSLSPTAASHVRGAFPQSQILVLDGGPCREGIESTVLWLADGRPAVLRPGPIAAGEIASVLGCPVSSGDSSVVDQDAPFKAPGMLASHYAPRTRAIMVPEAALGSALSDAASRGERVVLITHSGISLSHELAALRIEMPGEAVAYAAALFGVLHQADAAAATLLIIEAPPRTGSLWEAIHDRLARATHGSTS